MLIERIFNRLSFDSKMRRLKKNGLKLGENVSIARNANIDESHTWLIEINDGATITSGVTILAHDASMNRLLNYVKIGKVVIGKNVFIGVDSVILPNTYIGDNSIIAAGSVVSGHIDKDMVYGGVPAKPICNIETFLNKHKEQIKNSSCFDVSYTMNGKITLIKKKEMIELLDDKIGYIK